MMAMDFLLTFLPVYKISLKKVNMWFLLVNATVMKIDDSELDKKTPGVPRMEKGT
jgi:hypothetical protein